MSAAVSTTITPGTATSRPRIEGDREQQILDAALEVLAELGYDRLTMDAVAASARASKATLYRRWNNKAELVIEALCSHKDAHEPPDTGELRGDLLAMFCGMGADDSGADGEADGLADPRTIAILASVMTAVARDSEFAEKFRTDFIGPKARLTEQVFVRAQARGEIDADLDLDLIAPALPGIVLHRAFLLGQLPDVAFITRVVDQIIMPAVSVGHGSTPDRNHDVNQDSKDHS